MESSMQDMMWRNVSFRLFEKKVFNQTGGIRFEFFVAKEALTRDDLCGVGAVEFSKNSQTQLKGLGISKSSFF
jgi:hypothetical protein